MFGSSAVSTTWFVYNKLTLLYFLFYKCQQRGYIIVMNGLAANRRPTPKLKARKLARLNQKITRLNSELETLHFMQDRLEREIESAGRSAAHGSSTNKPLSGKMIG